MMWIPVLKVLAGLAAAVVLVWIASRKLRSPQRDERTLRSLPGNLVQEIADRLDQPENLKVFLKDFFGFGYHGSELPAKDIESFRTLLPQPLPEEEFTDLVRTAGAIEPDALLAYACKIPGADAPAVITVCRAGEGKGLLVGVFRPE